MYEAVARRYSNELHTHQVFDRCGHQHRDIQQVDKCVNRLADALKATAQVYDSVIVATLDDTPLNELELAQLAVLYKRSDAEVV